MTKTEISGIAPLFIVKNVPVALTFYRDRLGFDISALMEHDEKNALELINRFKEVLEKVTPEHQGRIIQYFGDGCLLAFESSTNVNKGGYRTDW